MKKISSYFLAILTCCLLFCMSACELENFDNGDLDGYWQLNSIDSLSNASAQEVRVDMTSQRVFWAVQGKLLQTRNIAANESFFLRFDHQGETLTVKEPHHGVTVEDGVNDEGDTLLKEAVRLHPYGINATWVKNSDAQDSTLTEQFKVIELNNNSMTLEGKTLRLHFVKF